MKTRKFDKKLALNKETVANLNKDEMKNAHGGKPFTRETLCPMTCYTCNIDCL